MGSELAVIGGVAVGFPVGGTVATAMTKEGSIAAGTIYGAAVGTATGYGVYALLSSCEDEIANVQDVHDL